MDLKKSIKTSIGGQALIEGVLMRGPSKIAVAVRKPNNEIDLKVEDIFDFSKEYKILNIPLIRGAYKLVESTIIGVSALNYSASFWEYEDQRESMDLLDKIFKDKKPYVEIAATVGISFILAALMFMVFPSIVVGLLNRISSSIVLNLIEGVFRLFVFGVYLFYISKLDDIQRVFQYHGSEHKSIHCYEAGEELTVENVKKYPLVHPRCGTSFMFMVMVLSIVVFSLLGWPNPFLRIISRVVTLPIIAGLAYEVNRFIDRNDSKVCKLMIVPGLLIQQYITVKEPDDSMIEVAIMSLKAVLPEDGEIK